MNFETADKAAERLGVTVRAIQKWAKEGKIPNCYKLGRDWMIPKDAVKPVGTRGKKEQSDNLVVKQNDDIGINGFYPDFASYKVGRFLEDIKTLSDSEAQAMALCEYYYMIGNLKECTITAEPYLDSESPVLRFISGLYCMFSNLCRGHLTKTHYASGVLKDTFKHCFDSNESDKVKAVGIITVMSVRLKLHLPFENVPRVREYIRFTEGGTMLYGCYLMAYDEYLRKEYSKALGIVETALWLVKEAYPLPMVYLNIVAAMAHINLHNTEKAKKCIEQAWSLSDPDGLIMPFVEHYNLLQGLIENHFKKNRPQFYNKIITLSKQYNSTWYKVYNSRNERSVATNLTNIEFTIAMLYSRNWRVKEIASHVHLSERTVTNYISYIYDKLHINSKKDLEKYMLK